MERTAYKYRVYPTGDQSRELAQTFGRVQYVYNGALALRTQAWFEHHERIDDAETDRLLVRREVPGEVLSGRGLLRANAQGPAASECGLREPLRGSSPVPVSTASMIDRAPHTASVASSGKDGNRTLTQMNARLDIRWTRPAGAEPTSVTVRDDPAGRSFVSFSTEEDVARLPEVNASVGLDLGLGDTVVRSTEEKVGNGRFLGRDEKRFDRAQRSLARKQKGPRNRTMVRRKVARIHARIADYIHRYSVFQHPGPNTQGSKRVRDRMDPDVHQHPINLTPAAIGNRRLQPRSFSFRTEVFSRDDSVSAPPSAMVVADPDSLAPSSPPRSRPKLCWALPSPRSTVPGGSVVPGESLFDKEYGAGDGMMWKAPQTRRQVLRAMGALAVAPLLEGCALGLSPNTRPLVAMEYETWFTCAVGGAPTTGSIMSQAVTKERAIQVASGKALPGVTGLELATMSGDVENQCAIRPARGWKTREATPILGTYDSANPTVIRQHAQWLAGAGVDFLLIDWSNNLGTNWGNGVALGIMSATYALATTYRTLHHRPKFALLLGLDENTVGTSTFLEQVEMIWNLFIQSDLRPLYQDFLGKPLLGIFTGPRSTPPPDWNDPRFSIRWVNGFDETTHGNELGYWSWIDRVPQVTYRRVTGPKGIQSLAEAVTVAVGYPGTGNTAVDWGGNEGARDHGQTYIDQWQTAFRARPEVVLLCQWNEFAQPDQWSVELSNDMEPTALNGYGANGNGGWGTYYLDLTKTMVEAFKAGRPQPTVKLDLRMP